MAALADIELGTFYLTDFLRRHFERLLTEELGINHQLEFMQNYFPSYIEIVCLAQAHSCALFEQVRRIASLLGVTFEQLLTGYAQLAGRLATVTRGAAPTWYASSSFPGATP